MTKATTTTAWNCALCSGALDAAIELPSFPLTGIFVQPGQAFGPQEYDQALMTCRSCGHAQLARRLAPELLYGIGYAHRSSASHLSSSASDVFAGYVHSVLGGRRPRLALEIGCNDLVLLRKVAAFSERVIGVDPIWRGAPVPADLPEGARLVGGFIEDIKALDLTGAPDLVYSTHNLEHLGEPVAVFRYLMDLAADDALFVIEVPDSTLMVRHLRFDQIFHQHYHYFTLASMLDFVEAVGGHYAGHFINYRNWGGSLSVAFTKRGPGLPRPEVQRMEPSWMATRYAAFRTQMSSFATILRDTLEDGPVWGYGAGQMVPAVAYHLDSDLGELAGILDDNPARTGLVYPHLKPVIRTPSSELDLEGAAVVVLALDGVRPIVNRLRTFNLRCVLTPACVF